MKQFINIYIISFVLILSQLSLFSSCKDEDTVVELKLDRTAIQIKEGSEGILKIEGGNGGYQFSFSEEGFHEIASSLYVVLYGAYDLCVRQGTIEQVAQEMEHYLALQQKYYDEGNVPETVKYALQFDKCIVTGTKNSYLISMYEHIEDIFYLMALHNNQRGEDDRHNNFKEHKMILKSIQEHDAAALHKWLGIHYDKHL